MAGEKVTPRITLGSFREKGTFASALELVIPRGWGKRRRGETEVGLVRPTTSAQHSRARRVLLEAARAARLPVGQEDRAARAVLAEFMRRVPADQRKRVLEHLPDDARSLAQPPRQHRTSDLHRAADLEEAVALTGEVPPGLAGEVTRAVLAALHELLPDEVNDLVAELFARRRTTSGGSQRDVSEHRAVGNARRTREVTP